MSLLDLLITLIIIIAVIIAIRHIIKTKGAACQCGCSTCPYTCKKDKRQNSMN